jgi:ABC-2 type transport system permease protein
MLRSVFTKTIWERRRGTIGWVIGGLATAGFVVAVYPVVRDSAEFIELIENLPDEFLALAGIDPAVFVTGYGYLQAQMYSLLGPLLVLILAIGIGASATAGEEAEGTADLLLATPVTRRRVVLDKALAMAVLVAILVLSFVAVLLVGQVAVGLDLSIWGLIGGNLSLWLLGLFFGSLALAVGAWSGRRAAAAGVAGGLAAASYILDSFAPLVSGLEAVQPYLPFHWYAADSPLLNGPTGWHLLLLAGAVAFTGAAAALFSRRDIGVLASLRLLPSRPGKSDKAANSTSPLLVSIAGKSVWDRRRSFWWWLVGIGSLAAMTIALFPSLESVGGDFLTDLMEAYPPALLAMFGITDPASVLTGGGFISSRVYQSIGLVAFLAFAIGMGKAALAGEEKEGTADLLLTTPPSRDRVVLGKAASMLLLLLALVPGVMLIIWIGDLMMDLDIAMEGLIAANLGMAFLAFLFGAIALLVGAITGRPGTAAAAASAVGVSTFLLNGFGAVVEPLEPLRPLSPFYWYQGSAHPLNQSLGWQQPLLLGVGLAIVLGAVLFFRRRDIGT